LPAIRRAAIARNDDRASAIALNEHVVEVAALDRIEHVDRKVVENEQVDGNEFPQLRFEAVIEAGALECFELLIGADSEDRGPRDASPRALAT
jgi:hypothetical protein